LSSPAYSASENPYGLPNDLHAGVGRRLLTVPINAAVTTTSSAQVDFPPLKNLSFSIPSNCSMVKLHAYNLSINGTGTEVFLFYNGTVTNANNVGQLNQTNSNGYLSAEILIQVTPGSTFTLNAQWFVTTGTGTWSSTGNQILQGFWVETA
jgi:hypothetical protein